MAHRLKPLVQYSARLNEAFGALSDPIRRGILEYLGHTDASITDLADRFDITLTGVKKYVLVLERSGRCDGGKRSDGCGRA